MGKIPWRRKWQPTPVLLPGKSHGRRSLVGCSPWGCYESDMTERLHFTSFLLGLHIICAKLLQLCLTLLWPCELSPTVTPQAPLSMLLSRQEDWNVKVKVKSLNRVRLFATPWTVAYQVSPSMGFSRQEYWSGLPLPSSLWLVKKKKKPVYYG